MLFDQIRHLSLREQVVEQIRTAIIEGRLRPRDHITEAAITQQTGVSRTPVREALILLEREGLVTSIPNRGSFVRAFNQQDVREIFSMRTNLENFTAELIIDKLNNQDFDRLEEKVRQQKHYIEAGSFKDVRRTDMVFDAYLIERSNHHILMRKWGELVAQIAALLYLRAEAIPDYDEYLAVRDHGLIIEAYKARDLQQVRACNDLINSRVMNECLTAVSKLEP
jgi:DNA-binding GntR family transcriptional regulator